MGRTVANGIRVLEKLGETSHGSLYRAESADSGVAVDLIALRADVLGSQLDGLWDQLSRARGINHPNIASVKGIGGTLEGVRYVALEALQGELLSEILDTRRLLPLGEAVDLMLQAASGLEAAHEVGLLHGSLSPDSILVTRTVDDRPLVKLIRFGLAQHGAAPPAGDEGSTNYTAPERLAGHPGDERSDIFSLGAVLHHLLTGKPPSAEPGEAELIPEAARRVISRALEPLPGHRFGTVVAFARALAAVDGESGEPGERAGRGRRGAVAIGAGLGIVAAAGVWLLPGMQQPRPEPISERRVTVGGAPPAAQAPDVSRRKSRPADAPPSVRKGPSATPKSAVAEVRESGPAPRRPEVTPTVMAPSSVSAGPAGVQPTPPKQPAPPGKAGPADSVLGYAPDVTAEPPAPTTRSLAGTAAMRLALSDVVRLHIVADYEEVRPGLLVLVLGSGYGTSTALEYNLRKLYAAYVDLLEYPENDPVMELWQNGAKIGAYARNGLRVGRQYVTPR